MKFDIATIITVSHGRLMTDIGNIYKILNYMLDDNLYTHQLPRAGRFCKNVVLSQHPQLDEWDDINEKEINENNYLEYVEKAKKMFGEELEINKVPSGVWTHKNPIDELEQMVSKDKIIVVENKKGRSKIKVKQ